MINKIIDGISFALGNEFGSDYTIYTDTVPQDLKEPCFSIVCVNPTNIHQVNKRYFRQNKFCIHYFPSESDGKIADCMDVLDRLYDCLEQINIDIDVNASDFDEEKALEKANEPDTLGTNMSGQVDDGVLSFMVNYDIYVVKVTDKTSMEALAINQKTN